MHVIKMIALAVLVLLPCPGHSQTKPLEKDPATLTVEEATAAATAAGTGEKTKRLVEAALQAERLDLIAVYLESINTNGMLKEYVRTLTASRFKDRIVVLILKSSPGWGWEPGRIPYGRQPIAPSINDEPFGSVIKRLLPGRSLTDDVFKSKASRLELASELEKAIQPDSAQAESSKPEVHPLPTPAAPASTAPTPLPGTPVPTATPAASLASTTPVAQTSAPVVEGQAPAWPWVIGTLALIVIVAVVLKRRA